MNKAIGIFDSGIGGLTVFKAVKKLLPNEKLIYFGDTARIPYGTKSKKLVQQYALEDAAFLQTKDVKMIVIACNTASAMALDYLKHCMDVPVIGVVVPGAGGAVRETKNNRIGVIGTSATINSNAYAEAIKRKKEAEVYSTACPLLVPLVEEGMLTGKITTLILKNYLEEILKKKIDTLILGCTHYPLLSETIKTIVGDGVKLIDSGNETAQTVFKELKELNILNSNGKNGNDQFYVSDIPQKFEEIGTRFLEEPLVSVDRINFDDFIEKNNEMIKRLKSKSVIEMEDAGNP